MISRPIDKTIEIEMSVFNTTQLPSLPLSFSLSISMPLHFFLCTCMCSEFHKILVYVFTRKLICTKRIVNVYSGS